jgi:hypothetical protein
MAGAQLGCNLTGQREWILKAFQKRGLCSGDRQAPRKGGFCKSFVQQPGSYGVDFITLDAIGLSMLQAVLCILNGVLRSIAP